MEAITTALIDAAVGIIAAVLFYLLGLTVKWVKAKLKVTDDAALTTLVSELCEAAEQLFGSGKGADKLSYVKTLLEEAGVATTKYIVAKIEAKVLKINQTVKETVETTDTAASGGSE